MDRYVYTNTVDGFSINYPNFDSKSNERLVLKESMRTILRKKVDAIDGKKEGSEETRFIT
jgi:hypothetical protein